jgi:N-acetylmuramoyl-L-alanine amidase
MMTRKPLTALFLCAFALCCANADTLKQAHHATSLDTAIGTAKIIRISRFSGKPFVSIPTVCEAVGFVWKWDPVSQKLTCTKKNKRLIFVQGMPFFSANDSLIQLIDAPIRLGGSLYLAPGLCSMAFHAVGIDSMPFQNADDVLSASNQVQPAQPVPQPVQVVPLVVPKVHDSTAIKIALKPSHLDTVKRSKVTQELVKTIVIDPGHGGMDPGAIGPGGLEEKKVVLDIGCALRDLFKSKTKFTVYMTRDKDVFIPLQDRTKFANEKKADIFVSIHANSIEGNAKKRDNTRGYKVYFLSQAKNEDDKLVAMRENAVIKLEDKASRYDNLQNILIEMVGNEYLRESQDFSIMLTESFHSSCNAIPRLHLGIGQANFWVLNGAYMPSVLIEVGFISNKKEEESLGDAFVRKNIAVSIFEAIMNFKKKYEAGS